MANDITISAANMAVLTNNAFKDCLFKKGEEATINVMVEGLTKKIAFHPQRLEEKRELVKALLAELPTEFKDGYSFLYLCITKEGKHWTYMQETCEHLVVMAIGLGLMRYCMPKTKWSILPGRVPYVIIM